MRCFLLAIVLLAALVPSSWAFAKRQDNGKCQRRSAPGLDTVSDAGSESETKRVFQWLKRALEAEQEAKDECKAYLENICGQYTDETAVCEIIATNCEEAIMAEVDERDTKAQGKREVCEEILTYDDNQEARALGKQKLAQALMARLFELQ